MAVRSDPDKGPCGQTMPDGLSQARRVARGEVTSLALVEEAIARAEAADEMLGILAHAAFDRARTQARRLDADQGAPGPLAGVPMLLSDLGVAVKGLPVSRGSRLLSGFICSHDSPLVKRLKATGAVLMGTARTAEFGLSLTTETALYGSTGNPWAPDHSAGGACGGAAAAVACGVVPIAHGSDLNGGLRIPAALCGVFALKPTRGRVPTGPRMAEPWAGLEASHVITRSVRDSAAVLDLTMGRETGDFHATPEAPSSYLHMVTSEPQGLRIAMTWRTPTGDRPNPSSTMALNQTADLLRSLGHEVYEAEPRFNVDAMVDCLRIVLGANLAHEIRSLSHALNRPVHEGVLEPLTWALYREGLDCGAADYIRAHETLQRLGPRFASFFEEYDVAVSLGFDGPAPKLGTVNQVAEDDLDAYWALLNASAPYTLCYNVTGHPAMVMPVGRDTQGLPISIQMGAGFGREDHLFMLAGQLERATANALERLTRPGGMGGVGLPRGAAVPRGPAE